MAALDSLDHYFGSFKAAADHPDVLDSLMQSDPYFTPPDASEYHQEAELLAGYQPSRLDTFVFDQLAPPAEAPAADALAEPAHDLSPAPVKLAPELALAPAQLHQAMPTADATGAQQQSRRLSQDPLAPPPQQVPQQSYAPRDQPSPPQVPSPPAAAVAAAARMAASKLSPPPAPAAQAYPSPTFQPNVPSPPPPPQQPLDAVTSLQYAPTLSYPVLQLPASANSYFINAAGAPAAPVTIGWPQALLTQPIFSGAVMVPTPQDAGAAAAAAASAAATWFPTGNKVPITRLATAPSPPVVEPPPAVRVAKKSAHNVIERRYRNNINERISELRSVCPALLPGEAGATNGAPVDDKMNKGKVLRRATEYIRYLKSVTESLGQENLMLRELVCSLGGEAQLATLLEQQQQKAAAAAAAAAAAVSAAAAAAAGAAGAAGSPPTGSLSDASTPPMPSTSASDDADDDSSDGPDDDDVPAGRGAATATAAGAGAARKASASVGAPAAKRARTQSGPASLSEGGRVLLVACVGLCLLAGPWSDPLRLGLGAGSSGVGAASLAAGGRVLHSFADGAGLDGGVDVAADVWTSWAPAFLWIALRVVGAVWAALLLMRGEPVRPADSSEFGKAQACLAQAQTAMAANDLVGAQAAVERGLETIGRPLPVTAPELCAALVWQLARQTAHVLRFGRWLDRVNARRSTDAQASFALAAALYDTLQRLQATAAAEAPGARTPAPAVLQRLRAVHGALVAVNLAEAAPPVEPATMARVYVVAAMQLHAALPAVFSFVPEYYMRLARWQLAALDAPAGAAAGAAQAAASSVADLAWLRTAEGHAFFHAGTWHPAAAGRRAAPLTHASHAPADPIGRFAALLREDQLARAFTGVLEHDSPAPLLRQLAALARQAQAARDVVAEWWAVIGQALVLDRLDQRAEAQEQWDRLRALAALHPERLTQPQCKALLLAATAHDAALAGQLELAMRAADRAARFIAAAAPPLAGQAAPSAPSGVAAAAAAAEAHVPPASPRGDAGDAAAAAAATASGHNSDTAENDPEGASRDGSDEMLARRGAPRQPTPRPAASACATAVVGAEAGSDRDDALLDAGASGGLASVRVTTAALAAQLVVEARLVAAARLRADPKLPEALQLKVLRSTRSDLLVMRRLAAASGLAQQQAAFYRLRAAFRGLAGGAVVRTAVLLDKAQRAARAAGLRYEEGAAQQAKAWLVARTPADVQRHLAAALYNYEQAEAVRDAHALKQLLLQQQ